VCFSLQKLYNYKSDTYCSIELPESVASDELPLFDLKYCRCDVYAPPTTTPTTTRTSPTNVTTTKPMITSTLPL
jgi:hypothetical protein